MDAAQRPKANSKSESNKRRRKGAWGLKVVEGKSGYFYIRGTVIAGDKSELIRKSTGIHRDDPDGEVRAEDIREEIEKEVRFRLIHGFSPNETIAAATHRYITRARPGKTDLDNARDLVKAFGARTISSLSADEIDSFYMKRFHNRAASTIRRHQATLISVLADAARRKVIVVPPDFRRPKVKIARGGAMMKRFLPGEAEYMIESASPHARPILATLFATGARVGSVIWLQRESFILTKGRGRIYFPETKNGNSYSRPLHDYAVDILLEWIETRRDGYTEMFLTRQGKPYKHHKARGGQIRSAFTSARKKLLAHLESSGEPERARILAKATPHWFRHNLANSLREDHAADLKTIMDSGMWESSQVVLQNYMAQESPLTDKILRERPLGNQLANPIFDKKKA